MLQKEKEAAEMADKVSDVELSRMIRPSRANRSAFSVESFSLDGVRYTVIQANDYLYFTLFQPLSILMILC